MTLIDSTDTPALSEAPSVATKKVAPQVLGMMLALATESGHFFSAGWLKKNGEYRDGVFRNSKTMSKGKTGEGLRYDPLSKGLFMVFDTNVKDYRTINVATLQWLKIDGVLYEA